MYYCLNDLFRQSTMVCTEKTGLRNLYSMLAYCTQVSECRRAIIAEHYNVEWNSSVCNKMCDICSESGDTVSKSDTNRITGMKLAELSCKKSRMSRELIEYVIAKLILDGYLKEDFHFTPYSIISYVVPGERSSLASQNPGIKITFPISSKLVTPSGKTKTTRKRPLLVDDDDDDDTVVDNSCEHENSDDIIPL
ncbi:unnamed protein product [Gongylonema pulchrum]|uniref:RecQ_Zn_bind domain-containing protein n=1 Tax=Gongylonema pulchrum TaxID=637853 RepID=A0A183D182_9BILA|nr:unnamed protein product [Gongylonema pulchrum]